MINMFIPFILGLVINMNSHGEFTNAKSFGALIALLTLAVIEDCIKTYRRCKG